MIRLKNIKLRTTLYEVKKLHYFFFENNTTKILNNVLNYKAYNERRYC